MSVATSKILLAAPVWAIAMSVPTCRKGVDSVYLLGEDAVLVIAGMAPIKGRARKAKNIYRLESNANVRDAQSLCATGK